MLPIIGIVVGCILLLIIGIFVYGTFLPKDQNLTVSREINATPETVWSVLTNWEEQPNWRDDIKEVKVLSDKQFMEIPTKGPAVTFTIIESIKPSMLKLKLEGSFTGKYEIKLSEMDGDKTFVEESYQMTYESPFSRVIVKTFFDLEDFANEYLSKLAIQAESL